MEMWKCSRCDTKNQDNMKFCQVCHAPRPADEPKPEPDKKKKTMIGTTIVGGPAAELITICGIMIDNELPVERMKSYVFPHPTCSEAIREAIFAAKL